jgi:hypothetical protein
MTVVNNSNDSVIVCFSNPVQQTLNTAAQVTVVLVWYLLFDDTFRLMYKLRNKSQPKVYCFIDSKWQIGSILSSLIIARDENNNVVILCLLDNCQCVLLRR